jgi:purine nucleoside phosphorylase
LGSAGVGQRLQRHAQGPVETSTVATPYGSVDLVSGTLDGSRFVAASKWQAAPFPPHQWPYRATFWALAKAGADRVLSTSIATALHESSRLGDCLVPDDYVDLTGRAVSFFDGGLEGTHHADMEEPFCARLSREFVSSARSFGLRVHQGGTIATIPGPHHPTTAEAARLASTGAAAASFSTATESKLARELGLCFVAAAVVVRTASPHRGWRPGSERERPAPAAEADLLRAFAEGRDVDSVSSAAPRGASSKRGPAAQGSSRQSRELERLKAVLQDSDDRVEQAAAAFVPHAAAYPPCTRCPRGAGPVPI